MFSELVSHYLFEDRFGRPGKGNDKGKVEGLVGYARRNFLVPVPSFPSFDALNAYLEERCLERMGRQLRGHNETIGQRMERDLEALLAFGMPGTGKTHAMCAIGHRLVESGRSVLFIPAYRLVQDMLAAKRDLELPRMLRKLDNFDLLVIDDLGYLPQGADESEVLFTLIAERYERRSLGITSNLDFLVTRGFRVGTGE